jgi:hypothetical protein
LKDNLGQWIFGNKRNKGENKKAENKFVCLEGRQAGQRGGGKFFPIVGKRPKIFSNHWKKRAGFSNHWKIFFQSLEKWLSGGELADCAHSGRPGGPEGVLVGLFVRWTSLVFQTIRRREGGFSPWRWRGRP